MDIKDPTRLQQFEETVAPVSHLDQRHHAPAVEAVSLPAPYRSGRWTSEEHELFLDGLNLYPKGPWNRIVLHMGTRTRRQVMAHAQKYRQRIQRLQRRANRASTHVMSTEASDDIDNVPTNTEASLQVIPVSSPIPSIDTTGEMESEAIVSPPDVIIRDSDYSSNLLATVPMLDNFETSPGVDVESLEFYGNLFNLLATAPMLDNFEMTSPSADVESLEFYNY
ncbi:hypothetical protein BBO99_00004723 [Phytophthora kernoviae]|uniref:Uncharacterized protein n=2 Tax=Phytophthora kernoviae TaxID=325452 RepID=A0A421F7N2_9STRA|nr:hypothetical protein G195_010582 [Phytophthora kernoviae 00238/432]KAG2502662.1 hypothetical protein JM16_009699 [Phytophthora kernoviae]KAG2502970.1 hypothetical protein JM18_009704 [Phytophthora kernoviae]RLN27052.1 hypothetical protein BBI17_002492 [Phytophthora kernoviae]RLN80139.1 hypothetical protein BBO99_00004723 [Phytophthora kernoviae]